MKTKTLYTLEELAQWLRVAPASLRNHVRNGQLEVIKVGSLLRVTPEHIEAYLAGKVTVEDIISALKEVQGENQNEKIHS